MLPKSALRKACDYLLSQWDPLVSHLHYGEAASTITMKMRYARPASARKTGSLSATPTPASALRSCTRSSSPPPQAPWKDPLAYLKDILTRLPRMTSQDDLGASRPSSSPRSETNGDHGSIPNGHYGSPSKVTQGDYGWTPTGRLRCPCHLVFQWETIAKQSGNIAIILCLDSLHDHFELLRQEILKRRHDGYVVICNRGFADTADRDTGGLETK